MKLIVRGASGEREIEVTRVEDGYRVELDGASHVVDSIGSGPGARSLLIDGRQWDLGVRSNGNGRYTVDSGESSLELEVLDPLSHLAESAHAGDGPSGAARVTAYMPGRVVAVLLAEGDEVEPGQGVVVLEAMKMENEIESDRVGTVGKIFVEPGQAVEGGDPLFEIV